MYFAFVRDIHQLRPKWVVLIRILRYPQDFKPLIYVPCIILGTMNIIKFASIFSGYVIRHN